MNIIEEQLARWAKAPSETEEEKCQNAISQMTDAIRAKFGNNVSIILQGSYKNRANVRLDSDVDIAVLHKDYYFSDVSGMSEADKQKFWADFNSASYYIFSIQERYSSYYGK